MDIELPDGALVLVDSSALVYLVEGEEGSPRRKAVESFFAEAAARAWTVIASTLIWKELLEKPLATEQGELAARYRRFLSDSSRMELRVVDVAVAEAAAVLAASLAPAPRRGISAADLVHVATAITAGADAILGNDADWRKIPRCPPIILIDESAHFIE